MVTSFYFSVIKQGERFYSAVLPGQLPIRLKAADRISARNPGPLAAPLSALMTDDGA
jgi:hypothetical protein